MGIYLNGKNFVPMGYINRISAYADDISASHEQLSSTVIDISTRLSTEFVNVSNDLYGLSTTFVGVSTTISNQFTQVSNDLYGLSGDFSSISVDFRNNVSNFSTTSSDNNFTGINTFKDISVYSMSAEEYVEEADSGYYVLQDEDKFFVKDSDTGRLCEITYEFLRRQISSQILAAIQPEPEPEPEP